MEIESAKVGYEAERLDPMKNGFAQLGCVTSYEGRSNQEARHKINPPKNSGNLTVIS